MTAYYEFTLLRMQTLKNIKWVSEWVNDGDTGREANAYSHSHSIQVYTLFSFHRYNWRYACMSRIHSTIHTIRQQHSSSHFLSHSKSLSMTCSVHPILKIHWNFYCDKHKNQHTFISSCMHIAQCSKCNFVVKTISGRGIVSTNDERLIFDFISVCLFLSFFIFFA